MTNIKIFTAFHKEFELPQDKNIFIPIHVGKANSEINLNMIWDDTWDNISHKNPNYCELTMLYWVWKNYDLQNVDYIWLAHYRRLFKLSDKILKDINSYDIIVPKKHSYNSLMFPILSMKHSYYISHIKEDFDIMYNKLIEIYPDYKDSAQILFKKNLFFLNRAYFFNIFLMKKEIFLEYCNWLFKILYECEKDIKISWYPYQARVFWFLAERLLNVFLEEMKKKWSRILELELIKK